MQKKTRKVAGMISITEFADAMVEAGHPVFRCKVCKAALWLEADNPETQEGLQMMRYSDTGLPDECPQCSELLGRLADPDQDWYNIFEMVVVKGKEGE